jgi:hypothetical protein
LELFEADVAVAGSPTVRVAARGNVSGGRTVEAVEPVVD